MKPFVLLGALCACLSATAQEPVDTALMRRIRSEALDHSQVAAIAHRLTDASGPRLTNSPGYRRAVEWATQTLRGWGLQKVAAEPWGRFGPGWENERTVLALRTPYYLPLAAYPVPWTGGTSAPATASLYLLPKLDSASIRAAGAALKGKIVLVATTDTVLHFEEGPAMVRYADTALAHLPDAYWLEKDMLDSYLVLLRQRMQLRAYLKQMGALALLRGNGMDGTVFVQSEPPYGDTPEPALTELIVPREDFMRLHRMLRNGTTPQLEVDVRNRFLRDDLNGYNVVAEIPGTDPKLKEQVVMLGGHLDSWTAGTGATDNAAGCIVMMEAVRILKSLGVQPRRTIRIALWGGEEQGLLGSYGYVRRHFGSATDMKLRPEQARVSAYFNLDNGSGKIRGIYLQNNEGVRPLFERWLAPFADLGATGITPSRTGATDHLSFEAVGIPGFQFIQDPLEYETRTHHSNMDVYDHLQLADLKQAATIVAAFVYNTAMRDELLPRKPLPAPGRFLFDWEMPK